MSGAEITGRAWAYYNEFDPFAAAWLRELIKEGLIADGEVDERSITDVQPADVRGFTQCHFFAGVGGWSYALRLAGWPDDRPVWTGSCPCQPFSAAGANLGGDDPRHLWPAWFRLIRECQPAIVFGEQVESAIAHGWLDLVCDDLEGEGYAVGAAGLPAASVGALHVRSRLWFVAHSERHQQSLPEPCHGAHGRVGRIKQPVAWHSDWEGALRQFRVVDDGLSYGVEACDGPRNAIVPQVAQAFIESYLEAVGEVTHG